MRPSHWLGKSERVQDGERSLMVEIVRTLVPRYAGKNHELRVFSKLLSQGRAQSETVRVEVSIIAQTS